MEAARAGDRPSAHGGTAPPDGPEDGTLTGTYTCTATGLLLVTSMSTERYGPA